MSKLLKAFQELKEGIQRLRLRMLILAFLVCFTSGFSLGILIGLWIGG